MNTNKYIYIYIYMYIYLYILINTGIHGKRYVTLNKCIRMVCHPVNAFVKCSIH